MQSTKKIAFQGVFGANSDLACRKFYPDYNTVPCDNFSDVFNAVIEDKVDCGIIPLENSYAGRVSEIHNLLQDSNVFIVAEHFLKIEHHLAGLQNSQIKDIKFVYSHPQAFMQCKNNLLTTELKQVECYNTAGAAKMVRDEGDKTKAALCSKLAAELYNLEIIKENMQDKDDNVTIFIVIAKKAIDPDPKKSKIITTMIFTIRNIPGSLYKALGGFATNNVNMIKWESYIPGGTSRQAKFFVSIEGHPSQENVRLALEEVSFFSKSVKVLGVYYADEARENG
jgi:prephenate dehydratase